MRIIKKGGGRVEALMRSIIWFAPTAADGWLEDAVAFWEQQFTE